MVPLEQLEPCAALHEIDGGVDAIPVETARRTTELFARHCHHAVPPR